MIVRAPSRLEATPCKSLDPPHSIDSIESNNDPGGRLYALEQVTDELVDLFDKLLGDINAKARKRLGDYQQSIAAAANDKVLLLAQIARVLLDPDLEDDNRLAALFAAVPKGRLVEALADCERIA